MRRLAYAAAFAAFAVFFANVCSGAFGGGVFLNDVAEMLTLFAAAIFFVTGTLLSEAKRSE